MKRLLGFLILLMTTVMLTCVAEDAPTVYTSGDYKYILLEDGTAEITDYTGKASKLALPTSLDGNIVTAIGNRAFFDRNSLTSVTIPDSITSIGDGAFSSLNLTRIHISPDHPTFALIDGVLFEKATKTLLCYPSRRTADSYDIPHGISSIANNAFFYCDLTSITIPDSVTSIGSDAFFFCESLTSISIPESVTSIGDSAFIGCESLTAITLPDSITSIADNTFSSCGSLISITIPDSIISIGSSAFYHCYSLTSITVPNSVTSIDRSAFRDCFSLTSITIPNSVTSISEWTFSQCTSLTSITIPDSVISIGRRAFEGCESLTVTVNRDSYAAQWCKDNSVPYTYPDANDWLLN